MLKTFFFDIGNVLIFFSREKMVQQVSACCGLKPQELERLFAEGNVLQSYETGKLKSQAVYEFLKERSRRPFTPQELFEAASEIFTPNLALWPLIDALKKAKKRLILLSNTHESHFQHLVAKYPIFQLFDEKVLSFEVQAMKPEKEIYQKALAKSLCRPEECFYTDDIPEYVAASRQLGIDAEVFIDAPTLKEQLAQRGLSKIV